jgi:hypothetical protein
MKSSKTTLAVKMDYTVAETVKKFCRERGLKYGFFVEKAIVEQMAREELREDLIDMKTLRGTESQAATLDDYLKKRRV